ncbi:2-octaprenyl-6-methoxyphenyl hydroxylase [Bermanella marisrubri]|uniref:2-octaprenyl-6-methoxyphenyl hydroxylase n=1 Tax=Bermanella marisrubri TaxID=207949 RepID=Q1MZJ9_9GAMM|nr:2-octaprenyl-6-methoxyphenyl hydroxylase [Bermanella marisrubri]EAT11412.1 2-octaprenyl-6-methoxyphenyl hydroxylase [Oceanobacter sp. RED65] [Bermanella marisrubri]QIZ85590.1 2-octaprenyl-6-methoxyphenyl hydroxylase [Bermanella marisrubri]
MADHDFDCIVVGGGMVGASFLLMLEPALEQGQKIAIIDQFDLTQSQWQQPSFDDRSSAISEGSRRILQRLGVWSELSKATPIEHIHVSQRGHYGRVRMHSADYQLDSLGHVVENRVLGQALASRLSAMKQSYPNLSIIAPAQVKAVNARSSDQKCVYRLVLDQDREISTGLLIAADGANSHICQSLGIIQTRRSYEQTAIIANIAMSQKHEQWAYERFTEQGPLALLPLDQNRYALVWCMESKLAEQRLALDDATFTAQLQKQIGFDKGLVERVGERQSYPLILVQAQEQVRNGLVVLGNAAHSLHPVAGQGFNLALRDARQLANVINKTSIGLEDLFDYAHRQENDQRLTVSASHSLPTLFQSSSLSILRGLALTNLDLVPTAKKLFARQAMGLVSKASVWRPQQMTKGAQ